MKVVCNYCGAEIDDNMPKCPYCDTMIPEGAEAQYMEKLYDIQEDMEELQNIPMDVVKEEMKSQGRRMKKIAVLTILVIVSILFVIFLKGKEEERDTTADYIWGQENFPRMSEMYENEEYDRLMEFYFKALEEDKPVWNWEYYEEFQEIMEEE